MLELVAALLVVGIVAVRARWRELRAPRSSVRSRPGGGILYSLRPGQSRGAALLSLVGMVAPSSIGRGNVAARDQRYLDGAAQVFGTDSDVSMKYVHNASGGYFIAGPGDYVIPSAVADLGAALQAAYGDLPASGGTLRPRPGSYTWSTTFQLDRLISCRLDLWGVVGNVQANTTAIRFRERNSGGPTNRTRSMLIGGLLDGGNRSNANGIEITDTDRVTIAGTTTYRCTTGLKGASTNESGSQLWCESVALEDFNAIECTTGIHITVNGGTGSFDQWHLRNVGLDQCTKGWVQDVGTHLSRTRFDNVTAWIASNKTGFEFNGKCDVLRLDLSVESFGTTTVNGIIWNPQEQNQNDTFVRATFTGAFTQRWGPTARTGAATNDPVGLPVTHVYDTSKIIQLSPLVVKGYHDAAPGAVISTTGGALNKTGPHYRAPDSYWRITATGQALTLDLGATYQNPRAVSFATHWSEDQNRIPAGYSIEHSTDNVTWTTLAQITGNRQLATAHFFPVNVAVRYVRITVTGFQSGQTDAYIAALRVLTADFAPESAGPWARRGRQSDDAMLALPGHAVAPGFDVVNSPQDAQPAARLTPGGLRAGPGGANALDVLLKRASATRWAFRTAADEGYVGADVDELYVRNTRVIKNDGKLDREAAANGIATLDANQLLAQRARSVALSTPVATGDMGVVGGVAQYHTGSGVRSLENAANKGIANGYAGLDANAELAQRAPLLKLGSIADGGAGAVRVSGTDLQHRNETDTTTLTLERQSRLGIANGYCGLDSGAKVPTANLPDATTGARGAVLRAAALTSPAASALTDSTGGTRDNVVAALPALQPTPTGLVAGERDVINNNFSELTEEVNALRARVEDLISKMQTAGSGSG